MTDRIKLLTFDAETKDPRLCMGKGVSWPYGTLETYCVGVKIDDEPTFVIDIERDGTDQLRDLIERSDALLAHNLQYELGMLESLNIPYKGKTLYDTMLASKLIRNIRMRHDLDSLAKDYLGDKKDNAELEKVADELGIVKSKVQNKVNLVKKNMDLLYYHDKEIMFKYCIKDVDLTKRLHDLFLTKLDVKLYEKYSFLCEVCVKMQKQGIKIDRNKLHETRKTLLEKKQLTEIELFNKTRHFNINSPKQRIEVFEELGLKVPYKERRKGVFTKCCDEKWMSTQTHEACKITIRVMKLDKIISMFLDGTESFMDENDTIHPSMNILQAVTGRFSSAMPNIQQVPSRDPELGALVRDIFIPFDGEDWYSMDFSAQEPRMLTHYAVLIDKALQKNSRAIKELKETYNREPKTCFHEFAVSIINNAGGISIKKKESKTVTLGILYGMGIKVLAQNLGVTVEVASVIKKAYKRAMPFIEDVKKFTTNIMHNRGHISTIGGRKCFREPKDYTILNRLVQGGCADQTMEAMTQLYKQGIVPLCIIHDEINISSSSSVSADKVKHVMENCLNLTIPSYTEIGKGKSWAEAH